MGTGGGLRTLLIAGSTSLGLVLYLVLWFRWPITLALALGVLMATLVVMTTASISEDPATADRAWREAAPDLVDQPGPALALSPDEGSSERSEPFGASESAGAAGVSGAPRPAVDGAGEAATLGAASAPGATGASSGGGSFR